MKVITADLTQQSRIVEAAACCLRDMSHGRPTHNDLRAVAAALEHSVSKLLQMSFVIENGKEGDQ